MSAPIPTLRILCCGSREWHWYEPIFDALKDFPSGTTLVHGGARGADRMAALVGEALGFRVEEHLPEWSQGKSAGFRRNLAMLDSGIDLVLAFWDGSSRGTLHTITNARRRGISTGVIEKMLVGVRTVG